MSSTFSPFSQNTTSKGNNSITESSLLELTRFIGTVYPATFCIIGLPLNIGNIFVVSRKWKVSSHFAYVTVLSFVDCLLLVHRVAFSYLPENPTSPLCAYLGFMTQTLLQVSSWISALLCLERAYIINKPFSRLRVSSSRRALIYMMLVTLIVIALNFIMLLAIHMDPEETTCRYRDDYLDLVHTVFNKIQAISYGFLPFVLMIISSIIICISLRESETLRRDRASNGHSNYSQPESMCLTQNIIASMTAGGDNDMVKYVCSRNSHRKLQNYKTLYGPSRCFTHSSEIQETKRDVISINSSKIDETITNRPISIQIKPASSPTISDISQEHNELLKLKKVSQSAAVYSMFLHPTKKSMSTTELSVNRGKTDSGCLCQNEAEFPMGKNKRSCSTSRSLSDIATRHSTVNRTWEKHHSFISSRQSLTTSSLPKAKQTSIQKKTANHRKTSSTLSPPAEGGKRSGHGSNRHSFEYHFNQIIKSIIRACVVFFLTTTPYCVISVFINFFISDEFLSPPMRSFLATSSVALCFVNPVANFFIYSMKSGVLFSSAKSLFVRILKNYVCGCCRISSGQSLWSVFKKTSVTSSATLPMTTRCSAGSGSKAFGGSGDGRNTNSNDLAHV